jgi:hypothetical protein
MKVHAPTTIGGAMREDTDRWYVYDHHNERVAMIYNETTIFYLYPSYGKEWLQAVEGFER